MPESASTKPTISRLWAFLPSLLLPLLALRRLGQDSNWDLRNYHLYNPYAWLHGRMALDIAPAQIQSWHNPLLDVPLYLMASAGWHGLLVSLWLTLPTMLALYFLLRLYPRLSAGQATRSSTLALALMAVTGAAAFSALGTSFNDAFVAAAVLGGLYLVFREDSAADRPRVWLLAGMLAGAVTGLKLTAAIYCLGLAGAACASPSLRRLPALLTALMAGGILGFVLTYGYWGLLLFHLHGNPFFPYYNQIFHSPDALPLANADVRFRPASLHDALLIPFRLLVVSLRYSEIPLRDPRLLLGIIGYALLLLSSFRRTADSLSPLASRRRMIAGFFFVSLLVWACQYGIYRYVLPLEMLACLSLVLALEWLPLPILGRNILALMASYLVLHATTRPNWGRTHFSGPMVRIQMPVLPARSMVVISSHSPIAYAAIALPDDVPVISIANNFMSPDRCTNLQASAERRVAGHAGAFWLLRADDPADDEYQQAAESYYGLSVTAACLPVATSFGELRLCPLARRPKPMICAMPAAATDR